LSTPRRRGCGPPGPARQRGLALLVAIILVALATVMAASIAYENALTARRGVATFAFDQALLVAQGAEALAAYGLRQSVQSNPKQLYVGEGWDQPYGPIEVVPGVMLEAWLEDLQGRFNLNNLVQADGTPDPVMVNAFNNLLARLGLESQWTGYIVDWIDADGTPSVPDGAEDSVYMGQAVPSRAANRYITSASELLALPGFGRERYLKIAPYVTALPHNTRINTCTASGLLLDAFIAADHEEYSDADRLAKTREQAKACYPTLADYQKSYPDQHAWAGGQATPAGPPAGSLQNPAAKTRPATAAAPATQGAQAKFAETSAYFRLTSVVSIGSTEFNLYSLLYQDDNLKTVRPIQRSFTPD